MLPPDSPTPDLSALDLLANGCALVRADGWMLFCNEALEHTLCLSRSQLRDGLRLQDFLLQPDLLLQGIAELQGETDRLQKLVDELLLPHRQAYLPVHLNVHEVCEYVRRVTLAQYPQGLELQRDYDLSLPELRGDKAQLIQTLLNIVQNAAEVLQPRIAAGDARIVLRTRAAHQQTFGGKRHRLAIKLEVIDNGPGIAPELLDTIFLPLVSGREDGSGLGLALAQAFILQHGGHVDVANLPLSAGAVFTIFLPLDSASE